jgi:hypothetical protein
MSTNRAFGSVAIRCRCDGRRSERRFLPCARSRSRAFLQTPVIVWNRFEPLIDESRNNLIEVRACVGEKGRVFIVSTRKTSGKADSGEAVQCGAKTKTAREPASLTSQGVSRMASRPPEDAALITVGFSVGVVSINRLHFILWSFGRAGD